MINNIMKFTGVILCMGIVTLGISGCENETKENVQMTGADTDAHGCKASAGYKWCAKTQQCERPWELAKKENFEKRAEAFDAFCNN